MSTKKSAGRPAKDLTDEQISELEKLSIGMTIAQIADYYEISESTFQRLKAKNNDIMNAYKKYRAKSINKAVGILWNIMESGTSQAFPAVKFYLETQAGYRTKQDVQVISEMPEKLIVQFSNVAKTVNTDS